ncbi:MAG: hypothetical protein K8L97_01910 [Anaerolineae bacterium]|nr:hypothetical protein [Anaerolineae bacterium]
MFAVLFCVVSTFVVPLIIGVMILGRAAGDPVFRFAGWMTLKPILATPLWFFMTSWLATNASLRLAVYVNWLPGAAITLLLVLAYRQTMFGDSAHPAALRLLGLDFARWISTAVMYATLNIANVTISSDFSALGACLIPLAVFMPTIFAVVAFYMVNNLINNKP